MGIRERGVTQGCQALWRFAVEVDDDFSVTGGCGALEFEDALAVMWMRDPDRVRTWLQRQAPERRTDAVIDPIHKDIAPRLDLQLVTGLP